MTKFVIKGNNVSVMAKTTKEHLWRWIPALGLFVLGTSSCIQDELPNSECDIEKVILHHPNPESVFYRLSDSIRIVPPADNEIKFEVRSSADLSLMNIEYILTEGATRNNVSEYKSDEIKIQTTSEDGKWNRLYTISFFIPDDAFTREKRIIEYNFEDHRLDETGKFNIWLNGEDANYWASGNPGYKLSKSTALPNEYPTIVEENGYSGHAVSLVTRTTGKFGEMAGMPIAAGNLFAGSFDVSYALKDAMAATLFGKPFQLCPMRIKCMAKYKAGDKYKKLENKKLVDCPDMVDYPDMYAVLYKNTDSKGNTVTLRGDDGKTNPNIVARAFLSKSEAKKLSADKWTEINIPFEWLEECDEDRLANRGYNFAIVFTSSYDGGNFSGAEGSIFTIDEVRLICNEDEE